MMKTEKQNRWVAHTVQPVEIDIHLYAISTRYLFGYRGQTKNLLLISTELQTICLRDSLLSNLFPTDTVDVTI